jgi:FKBP-type peptidyl-prolyl cis-trans isomerase FklB
MMLKWIVVAGICLQAAQVFGAEPQMLKTPMDKMNYGIGVTTIRSFKQQGLEIDLDMVVRGMRDALSGKPLLMSDDEIRATMMAVQTDIRQRQRQAKRLSAVDNKKEGDQFLAANSKKKGVVTLPDGLQYLIIKKGDGKKPTDSDTVLCHYRTTLINGTEIDSTYTGNKPVSLRVRDGVIPGWNEVLKLMPVGSKWQLFIPPQLAYGAQGSGMTIGPNETLIFEVELLAIK